MKIIIALMFLSFGAFAQTKWNGYKSAVVLTYDDALNVHLDNVVPALDSAGFKGTFYLTVSSSAFTKRMDEWKITSIKGHELGNHTMYHPCMGGPDRTWVKPEYDLNNYSIKRIDDEIRMTNVMLQSVDGKTERTFAYPCADTKAGGQSYIEAITDDFLGARGVRDEIVPYGKVDVYNTACFSMVNASGEQMIELVKKGMKENGLVIFLFHGVGGEHNLNVDLKEHRKLIHFLKENQKDIWVAPFIDVVKFLKASQH
jgi:peptidoglycan/xylan/chitin deacetylase (PgdA/CDA1 family)